MKKTIFRCDRCSQVIPDIVYVLTCYGEVVPGAVALNYEDFHEMQLLNDKQNAAKASGIDRHLCRKCKDEITDGVFLV